MESLAHGVFSHSFSSSRSRSIVVDVARTKIRFIAHSYKISTSSLINSLKMALNCKWYTYFMAGQRIQLYSNFRSIPTHSHTHTHTISLIFGVNFDVSARSLQPWLSSKHLVGYFIFFILCSPLVSIFRFIDLSKMVHLWLCFGTISML